MTLVFRRMKSAGVAALPYKEFHMLGIQFFVLSLEF
jgi:hypothetical protein